VRMSLYYRCFGLGVTNAVTTVLRKLDTEWASLLALTCAFKSALCDENAGMGLLVDSWMPL